MTEREIALYETMKIVRNHMISSGLMDYHIVRRTLNERESTFSDRGMHLAAQMMGTLKLSVEPKRVESRSPHPLSGFAV